MNDDSSIPATSDPYAGHEAPASYNDDQAPEPVDFDTAFQRAGLDPDTAPDGPDGYELAATGNPAIDEALAASLEHGDSKLDWFTQRAAELGLSQRQYNQIIQEYVAGTLSQQPDTDAEIAQLGPRGAERLSAVEQWAGANLPPDAQEWLAQQPVTAGMVSFLEAVADSAGSPLTYGEGSDEQVAAIHKDEIRKLQATPEYQRGDKATVARVRRAYAQLAQQRARGRHP